MMKTPPSGVSISILGKELMVACPDNERESLAAALVRGIWDVKFARTRETAAALR